MKFIDWLRDEHGYTGDDSETELQAEFGADELDYLYADYLQDGGEE